MRTKFIRNVSALLLSVTLAHGAHAQGIAANYIEPKGWSLGMNLGLSDLWGDVGTKSIIDHYNNSNYGAKTHYMGGIYARYTFHPALSVRLQVNYGSLYANDDWNINKAKKATTEDEDAFQRYARNQDIRDIMWEGGLMLEFDPFRMNPESRSAHRAGQVYLLAGVNAFHFQPYSTFFRRGGGPSEYVKIYDLHLEGDGFGAGFPPAYSLWQMAIPLGIGYRFDIGNHLNLGIEYVFRLTFTDYLDGVSNKYISNADYEAHLPKDKAAAAEQIADKSWVKGYLTPNQPGNLRGNPSNKDSYSTISISFFYKVKAHKREWWY